MNGPALLERNEESKAKRMSETDNRQFAKKSNERETKKISSAGREVRREKTWFSREAAAKDGTA